MKEQKQAIANYPPVTLAAAEVWNVAHQDSSAGTETPRPSTPASPSTPSSAAGPLSPLRRSLAAFSNVALDMVRFRNRRQVQLEIITPIPSETAEQVATPGVDAETKATSDVKEGGLEGGTGRPPETSKGQPRAAPQRASSSQTSPAQTRQGSTAQRLFKSFIANPFRNNARVKTSISVPKVNPFLKN